MANYNYSYIALLVERAKQNDSDAFAELYALSYHKQFVFTYHYLKDEHLAQDALQEVYILALKNIHSLKDGRLFISWLNQINFHVCYNMKKKQMRNLSELNDMALDLYQDLYPDHNPEQRSLLAAYSQDILDALRNLPPMQQQLLVMKHIQGMKLQDIADAMDCSLSTIKRQLRQGKKDLKDALLKTEE